MMVRCPPHRTGDWVPWYTLLAPYTGGTFKEGALRGLACPVFMGLPLGESVKDLYAGYHYNANLDYAILARITMPAQSPWGFDGSGMGAGNPYGGWPGGGGWYHPKYRHNNTINLVMVDGHVENKAGIYNPDETQPDVDTEIDWGKDGKPYYWHYLRNPYNP